MRMRHRHAPAMVLAAGVFLSSLSALADGPERGAVPPDYVGSTIDREPVHVSDYAGRVVVVTFWASWCPPCRKELPVLDAIQKKAGSDALQVIAVNVEDFGVYRKAVQVLDALSVKLVSDADRRAQRAYDVQGYPHMVIIGRNGKIVRVSEGYDDAGLDELLDALNGALAAPSANESLTKPP